MNKKYLITLLSLIVVAQSFRVSVSDSEGFIKPNFYNYINVPNVVQG